MKILNLNAGIGGNRKLLGDEHEITAIENNKEIAAIYQDFFPNDKVIVTDAHKYLLEHYKEFDFIWSGRPCQSHSKARYWASKGGRYAPVYPDMKLYEEIVFLNHFFDGKFVVENVDSYYPPLIKPQVYKRHYYWSNFIIDGKKSAYRGHNLFQKDLQELKGFDVRKYKLTTYRKDQLLRNCVEPKVGLYILNCAFKEQQKAVGDFTLT